MLISKKHKIIFVHVPKTGGTSITRYLKQVYEKDVTAVFENRTHQKGPKRGMRKHITAEELRGLLPNYEEYTKIAVVRNPWDRVLSWYSYVKRLKVSNPRSTADKSFSYFIKHMPEVWNGYGEPTNRATGITQWHHVSAGGKIIVDVILRYEDLKSNGFKRTVDQELKDVGIGLPKTNVEMPHINKSNTNERFQAYYDEKTKVEVEQCCYEDVEAFGYSFDEN